MFNFDEILNKAKKQNTKEFENDNFFKFKRNDKDQATGIIRFIPGYVGNEIVPFLSLKEIGVNHYHLTKSKKFISELITVDELFQSDILKIKRKLKEIGTDEALKINDTIKARSQYVGIIKTLKLPLQKDDEGKYFLYKWGEKLQSKFLSYHEKTEEEIEMGEKPVNIWNVINGADIKIIIKKVGGFINYDDTTKINEGSCLDEFCNLSQEEVIAKIKEMEIADLSKFQEKRKIDFNKKLLECYKDTWVEEYLLENLSEFFKKEDKKSEDSITIKKVGDNSESKNSDNEKTEKVEKVEKTVSKENTNTSSNQDDDLDFLDDDEEIPF